MQERQERRWRAPALALARVVVLIILAVLAVNIARAWPSIGGAERAVLLLLAGGLAWAARALRR